MNNLMIRNLCRNAPISIIADAMQDVPLAEVYVVIGTTGELDVEWTGQKKNPLDPGMEVKPFGVTYDVVEVKII